jgi:hypothetical protein
MRNRSRWLMIGVVLAPCAFGVMSLIAPTASAVPPGQPCGGKPGGLSCPEGFTCVDLPGDHCDPKHGGADCGGYCKRSH